MDTKDRIKELELEVTRLKKKVNGILAFTGKNDNSLYYIEREYWDDDGKHYVGYVLAEEEVEYSGTETSKYTFNTTLVKPTPITGKGV